MGIIAKKRWIDFNPRSPRGERQYKQFYNSFQIPISIHAPREGSDPPMWYNTHNGREFQSTLPARGATAGNFNDKRGSKFQSTLPARGATLRQPL